MKNLLALFISLLLTACGGGGGGGSTSSGSPGSNSTGLQISFSTATLSFEYMEGTTPYGQTMTAFATGTTTQGLYVGAIVHGSGLWLPISVSINKETRSASIYIVPQDGLPIGTYTGTIEMLACTTPTCTQHHGGSPFTVSYTITVKPGLQTSVSSLNLTAPANGVSGPTSFTVTSPVKDTGFHSELFYGDAHSSWLSYQTDGDTITVQASAGELPPGTYRASLIFTLNGASQRTTIPVTLTVTGSLLNSVPAGVSLAVDSNTTTSQLASTIAVSRAAGTTAAEWKASSDQAWFKLDTAGGNFSKVLAWHIDAAAFSLLPNGHYKARVTLATESQAFAGVVFVDVEKKMAQISSIDNLALEVQQGGDIMLYGSGFNQLAVPATALLVSGTTPSAVTRLSDGLMRLTMPPLAAGSYDMTLASASGISTPKVTLNVVVPSDYQYQVISDVGTKSNVIWDAVRKSVFLADKTTNVLKRYAVKDGKFQLETARSFTTLGSIGMTPDHSALIVFADASLYKLSPLDLSTLTAFSSGLSDVSAGIPLGIMADNRMMVPDGWMDLNSGVITAAEHSGWGVPSGDGKHLVLLPRDPLAQFSPTFAPIRFDLADGSFKVLPMRKPDLYDHSAVSYDGSRWAGDGLLVDSDWNILGYIYLPSGWTGGEMVLSRDGTRLYYYAREKAAPQNTRVFVFDTAWQGGGVLVPLLGFINIAELPSCRYDPSANCYTFSTLLTLTDDNRTLFLAGDVNFEVIPVPEQFRSVHTNPVANRKPFLLTQAVGKR